MRLLSLTSIRRVRRHLLAAGIVLSSLGGLSLLGGPSVAFAQVPGEPAPASRSTDKRPVLDTTLIGQDNRVEAAGSVDKALLDKFQKLLTGAKMNGMFTVDGRPMDKLSAEQYAIEKVEKQPDGDWWLITARITYGEKDFSLPVPVEVKWAGTTPVITLDKVTLPGYGTFSARVVFHGDRYAGTWQHDDKGGHLFGKIELAKQ
jgi:hypothetical protein